VRALRIYDEKSEGVLIGFAGIAEILNDIVDLGRCWAVLALEGQVLPEFVGRADEIYKQQSESTDSPMTWEELEKLMAQFFQVYDCDITGRAIVGIGPPHPLRLICFDSSYWEIASHIDVLSCVVERAHCVQMT